MKKSSYPLTGTTLLFSTFFISYNKYLILDQQKMCNLQKYSSSHKTISERFSSLYVSSGKLFM